MKRQRLPKHLELPPLYEKFEPSQNRRRFVSAHSINRKNAQVVKQPERVHNAARSPLTILYEIEPNRYDGLSFTSQEKINVKFER